MSGGLDSTMAAFLLKRDGYDVEGVTLKMWKPEDTKQKNDAPGYIEEARLLAAKIGIKHYVIDIQEKFKSDVVGYFADEYLAGRTPNPCVQCNRFIKWDVMLDLAKEIGCDKIATGHYSRLGELNDRYFIRMGKDELKDQSYFLWPLGQRILSQIIFPLAEYTKDEIRGIANENGFQEVTSKSESQDICFIADNDYRNFLRGSIDGFEKRVVPGNFLSTDGKILGQHKGYPFYTIGQRKGLEIALGVPMYVAEIRADRNEVVLGNREDILKKELVITGVNLQKYETVPDGMELTTRIRYRNKGAKSRLVKSTDGIKIIFDEAVSAVTPGQSAVFYEGDDVVGGGFIRET